MNIYYRNDCFKIISEDEVSDQFSGYRDYVIDGILKIRERYIAGCIFALHYYKNTEENENEVVEQFKNIPDLKMLSVRERKQYGDFKLDHIRYFNSEKNEFLSLIIRELYNHREQKIAWECTDLSLSQDNEFYYQLSKQYYHTEDGSNGKCFISHFKSCFFTDIEYFSEGFDTDDQDIERGFEGESANLLMSKMNISAKMKAWYVNSEFLPIL
ncbi:hypothetical protein [Chryseobacterium sp. JK1]|uniref:hypothetical protein n=1 Tax=Chryseobacterium sp. JK1 TaxID=874294 RepID=UPI003D696DA5